MIRHKVKQLDLFIKVVDEMYNKYIVTNCSSHADYSTYSLQFGFENWTDIIGDGKKHIHVTAEYVDKKGGWLVKFQDEDWSKLCDKIKAWNDTHRVDAKDYVPTDDTNECDDNVLFKDLHDLWINGLLNFIEKCKNFFSK